MTRFVKILFVLYAAKIYNEMMTVSCLLFFFCDLCFQQKLHACVIIMKQYFSSFVYMTWNVDSERKIKEIL